MKFNELADEWLNIYSVGISYGYKQSVKYSLKNIKSCIGEIDILDIKPLHINRMITSYAIENPHTKKPTSKKLLRYMVQITRSIFEFAIDNDFVSKNPARKIKIPTNAPVKKREALTTNEQILVLNTQHRCQLPALIMLLCGLRKGEIIGLEWKNIDLDKRNINVCQSARLIDDNTYTIKNCTKNGTTRVVPIPTLLYNVLRTEKSIAKSSYLTYRDNGDIHTRTSFDKMWKSYEKTLNYAANGDVSRSYYDPKGIPKVLQHITPHMLRHTYATILYTSGVDVLTASKLLGHLNVEVTLKIYTHLQEEKANLSIESFNVYLGETFSINC